MSCCPGIWYCTPDGLVDVYPDEDGVYTPPSGFTGGPFASADDATGDCECLVTATCHGEEYTVPTQAVGTLADCTGAFTAHSSESMENISPYPCSLTYASGLYGFPEWPYPTGEPVQINFVYWGINLYWGSVDGQYRWTWVINSDTHLEGVGYSFVYTPAPGWTSFGYGAGTVGGWKVNTGYDTRTGGPVLVGRLALLDGGAVEVAATDLYFNG